MAITAVGIDADDTLWHSENRFQQTHQRFHDLLEPFASIDHDALEQQMLETEQRNLRLYGYGAKGFTLSLIETAIEVTDGAITTAAIGEILSFGHDLLDHPVELLPGVADTIETLREHDYRLVLITKGDLWHQESKVAASGLAPSFEGIEIVSEKDPETYGRLLETYEIDPSTFCMIGNSVRSDILPIIELGGHAIHVPYEYTWAHEAVDTGDDPDPWATVASITEAPPIIAEL